MMKQRILLLLLLLSSWQAWAQVPRTESFETDGNNVAGRYTSNTFNTSNNNYSFRTDYVQGVRPTGYSSTSRLSGIDQTYYWTTEGVNNSTTPTPLAGTPAYVQLTPTTITGYTDLKVTVLLADPQGAGSAGGQPRWEADDYIRIKVRVNPVGGTGTWETIGQFTGDRSDAGGVAGYLRRDVDLDNISTDDIASGNSPIDGTRAGQLTATLQPFTFSVTGGGATLDVKVEIDQVGNSEEFAFDKIQITGTASSNALPQLATNETTALAYTEGTVAVPSAGVAIVPNITVSDADNTTLSSATIRISGNFDGTEDRLLFTNQNGISGGTFNTTTGTLTLTGTASLAAYQTALRSVQYQNIDNADASPLTRTVSFTVTDPAGGTNTAVTRTITVTTALDAAAPPPYIEDFTTDGEGRSYATNHFGPASNNTIFQRTNVTPYPGLAGAVTFTNISNGYYFYGSGVSNAASPNVPKPVYIQTRKIDATGYANLQFQVRLGARPLWYKDNYIKFYYRIGNNAWVIFASFRAADQTTSGAQTALRQDVDPTNLSSAPTGTALSTALQNFTFNLPAALNGQQIDIRMEASGNNATEEFAVDLFQVTGTSNTAPTISNQTRSIAENSANGTNVGAPIVASDADAGQTLSYAITAGNTSGAFAINSSTGQITVANSAALNYEAITSFSLTVQVTDNGTPAASASATVTVNVTNVNEAPGAITDVNPASNTVAENAATGTSVGITASATDPEGTTLSYSLTDNAGGRFQINASTGVVTVANGTLLNFEAASAHSITVQASDGSLTSSQSFIIAVTNVNEAPSISAQSFNINENSANGTTVGTVVASDPDAGTTLTYSITAGNTGGAFTFVGNSLRVANSAALDFETTPTFTLTVQVSDGSLSSSATVTVNLNDVDDTRPTVSISSSAGANGSTTATTPVPFTITFSESVTGFAQSDLTVNTGTISGFSGSGTTYDFFVTVPSGTTITVNVAQNVAQDGAGNGNTAASPFSITYQQPVVAVAQNVTVQLLANGTATLNASSVNNGSTGGGTLTYTIQKIRFGQAAENGQLTLTAPTGFTFTSIPFAVYGSPTGSAGNYGPSACGTPNGSGGTPGTDVRATVGALLLNSNSGAIDATNNTFGDPCPNTSKTLAVQAAYSSNAASQSYGCNEVGNDNYVLLTVTDGSGTSTRVARVTVVTPPTATITNVTPDPALRGATVTVSGTNLSGATSLTVNGASATISNLTSTGFTFVVPNGAANSGNLVLNLPCSQTLTRAFTAQTVTATPVLVTPANGATTGGMPVFAGTAPGGSTVTFYLNNQNIGTTSADASGNFGVQVGSMLPSGSYTLYVTAQSSGQAVSANSATVSFTIDSTGPTATITSTGNTNGGSTSTAPIPFTVTFSESVTGFTASDLTVGNGAVTGGSFSGSGSTYTFTVTPFSSGAVTVNVPASAAIDGAGNGNTVATQFSITYTQPVTATPVVLTPANGSFTNDDTPTFTGTAVANSSITLYVDGVFSDTTFANAAGNWRKTRFSPLAEGSHTIYVTAQATGQAVSNNSNTNTFVVDTTAPTVTLNSGAGTSGSSTTTSPFAFTATFSESVTGFVAGDLTVTNGTVTGFSGSGTTYNFTVTPTTPGTVTNVTVSGNSTQDAAGNGNSASATYALTFAPTSVVWTGSQSTDWYAAANWTPALVPTATLNATIPTAPSGGRFPVITSGAAVVRNLTINSGATLSQTDGTLDVRGNLTTNGSFLPASGTVVLGTDVLTNLLGSSRVRFWNLTVNSNGTQLSTSAGASVRRVLLLNGTLTTNGNDFVTESDATRTAMVVNNGSNVISGNVTVQRNISTANAGPGYRHYSAPVSNATVGDLGSAGFTPVVNPAYNTAAQPGLVTPFPNVYGYDQSRLGLTNDLDFFSKGWFSPNALSDALTVAKGYAVNISGGQTFTVTGPQNNGTYTQSLARGPQRGTPDQSGWHLVGNPYPSPLDYAQVDPADRVNLDGAIYVFASDGQYTGNYGVYNNGVGNISPVLALGQGFFTRVSQGQTSGSLTLRNSQRVTTYQNPAYNRTSTTRPLVQLDLQGASHADPLYVYFEQGATTGMDSEFDAVKLPNTHGLNLSAVAGNLEMAINGLPLPAGAAITTVPLQVRVPATGTYTLHAASIVNLPAGLTAYLRDRQTGAVQDLSQQPDYTFALNAAYTGVRFELFFTPQRVTATAPASLAAQVAVFPNPAHKAVFVELPATLTRSAVSVALVDALGRTVLTQPLTAASSQLSLEGVAAGVYAVRLTTAQGIVTKKLTVE